VTDPAVTTPEQFSRWEWISRMNNKVNPQVDEVERLLKELPKVWGVDTIDFIEYVHAIGQRTNVAEPDQPKDFRWVVRLYMSVAGRIKMLEKAQGINTWSRVELEPEPNTPTGMPGILVYAENVVYRVNCKVYGIDNTGEEMLIGTRSGTSSRIGSNSWEKAETAANGRAIAEWGFGVLPGSGVASAEEMQNPEVFRAQRMEAAAEAEPEAKETKQDIIQELAQIYFEAQQVLGLTDEEIREGQQWFLDKIKLMPQMWDADYNQPKWQELNKGQLLMWRKDQRKKLDDAKAKAAYRGEPE